ncbi:MAG: hypothetical protein MUW56_00035 [Chryseobacterium sp.]|uniref:hypothetical protein n=1 Tax=Chryseobacterium sp. TaxID=1871047 RepID=UPI0025BE81CE|nr:hypothetical protein [Chryseobacterium sp.]MCJ7932052.1 hypothetical protein [Chryseobacterium sp.]
MAAELNKVGLEFRVMGEGLTEIHSLPGYYESVFKNNVTPDYDAYISQMAKDNKENYAVNGGLLMTWEELGDRLIVWENFINKYPKSPLIKSAKISTMIICWMIFWEWTAIRLMTVMKGKFLMIKGKHATHSSKNIQILLPRKKLKN